MNARFLLKMKFLVFMVLLFFKEPATIASYVHQPAEQFCELQAVLIAPIKIINKATKTAN